MAKVGHKGTKLLLKPFRNEHPWKLSGITLKLMPFDRIFARWPTKLRLRACVWEAAKSPKTIDDNDFRMWIYGYYRRRLVQKLPVVCTATIHTCCYPIIKI